MWWVPHLHVFLPRLASVLRDETNTLQTHFLSLQLDAGPPIETNQQTLDRNFQRHSDPAKTISGIPWYRAQLYASFQIRIIPGDIKKVFQKYIPINNESFVSCTIITNGTLPCRSFFIHQQKIGQIKTLKMWAIIGFNRYFHSCLSKL